ncbi:MAG: hypothetical protein R3B12_02450 [Candidatus Saccharimonadales bacterium]
MKSDLSTKPLAAFADVNRTKFLTFYDFVKPKRKSIISKIAQLTRLCYVALDQVVRVVC